jgi:putative ABC transport system substrate-binding protein
VCVSPDPVGAGLVTSLARPGGNITGLTTTAGMEIFGKQLEILKETVPKLARIAILSNPSSSMNPLQVREMQAAASRLSAAVFSLQVKGPDEFDSAFTAMRKKRTGALSVLPDPTFLSQRNRIAELAAKNRLPSIYGIPEHAEAGGLMAYAANRPEIFRRAATYVDKILKGTRPSDLPLEQPRKFELLVNLKTAKQIGLTIPPNVLYRADRVIK